MNPMISFLRQRHPMAAAVLALLVFPSTSASAQRIMKVTKMDDSVVEIPITDVKKVSFEDPNAPDAAVQAGLCPDNHHPHKIDLGIDGVQWSCCNEGASTPWESGSYYAWGETAQKSMYNRSTYAHRDGSSYNYLNIGSDISGTQYDAATAHWGAPWRLPTTEENQALLDQCSSEWTTLNDVNGRKFTGSNGNSIFLPAAGYCWDGEIGLVGSDGNYWSSTLGEEDPNSASSLYIGSGYAYQHDLRRDYGLSLRPVCQGPDAAVHAGLCPDNHHPHVIDLGIDGVQWSCCNVGASAPWEYGGYYSWAETSTKEVYNWSTYTYCDGSAQTCYIIGSNISGSPSHDTATTNWGAPWRLPTTEEYQALLDQCSSEWTTLNGVNGRKFTAPNGASLFLPAAGSFSNSDVIYVGSCGYYWSSMFTKDAEGNYFADDLFFGSDDVSCFFIQRSNGISVRPVR